MYNDCGVRVSYILICTSAVPVRICPLNGYWSRVHSFEYKAE